MLSEQVLQLLYWQKDSTFASTATVMVGNFGHFQLFYISFTNATFDPRFQRETLNLYSSDTKVHKNFLLILNIEGSQSFIVRN